MAAEFASRHGPNQGIVGTTHIIKINNSWELVFLLGAA